ncbi:MAG: PKD domain-containing protein [Myxococcaceae bacterium]|nr:PKD domain-containing protein [Myxococcaceae bacterium]
MRVLVSVVVVAVSASCVRAVREERREQPVDTGQLVRLSSEGPRRWDFGDGATASGQVVEHAFTKAGRYEVKALDGDRVTDRVSVLVQPRDVFHAVVPGAEAVLVFRTLDDVGPAIDFVERLGSVGAVQRLVERAPVLQFALEPGRAGVAAIDRAEGAGTFLVPGVEALVTFFGVHDEAGGTKAFREFLVDHGWREAEGRFVSQDLRGKLFADRGTVWFVTGEADAEIDRAAALVLAAPTQGLVSEPAAAAAIAELASGGVAVLARPSAPSRARRVAPQAWSIAVGALHFGAQEGRLVAKLLAAGPLWKTPPRSRPARLLANTAEGPIAAVSLDVPVVEVLDAFGLGPRSGEVDDEEVRAGLAVLSRRLDLSLYADVDAFLAATIRGGGRPAPRVTLLAEAAVPDRVAVRGALERLLMRRREPVDSASEGDTTIWRTVVAPQPLELALDRDTLYARWGRPLDGAAPIDLVSQLARRSEGACGPGHVTAFIDVGQLGRDLLEPRMVPGLDPRKVITTQALTSTFVTQLTSVEQVFLDLAPTATGASLLLEVKLSPPERAR